PFFFLLDFKLQFETMQEIDGILLHLFDHTTQDSESEKKLEKEEDKSNNNERKEESQRKQIDPKDISELKGYLLASFGRSLFKFFFLFSETNVWNRLDPQKQTKQTTNKTKKRGKA